METVGDLDRPLQPLLMARSSRDALLAARPGRRPFVISRSGTIGTQRYAQQTWSGDNHPGWGISGDAHHPAPPSKKNSKESSRKSVDLYPTGRRSFDMSNNIVGKALDTDVKTQQNLDKEGLSAFI